ncbi:MAG: excisionase family DNA-binding protein [Candidatus Limnocylindrales bacterium]|nr:excisionase family DNA-binding protein [Candidatus Limnocylindrales bacterium]
MSNADYLSAGEAAVRLGISLRTVRRRIADGSLPSARIGRAVRIPAAAIELPTAAPPGQSSREAVAPYVTDAEGGPAAYVIRWNAAHWPDTFERMLDRRRRAFDVLDAIRARSKPPSGPSDTVDAILDAVRDEFGDRLAGGLPPPGSVT